MTHDKCDTILFSMDPTPVKKKEETKKDDQPVTPEVSPVVEVAEKKEGEKERMKEVETTIVQQPTVVEHVPLAPTPAPVPEVVSETIVKPVPEIVPEVAALPEVIPEQIPEPVPEAVPEQVRTTAPEVAPEPVPEIVSEQAPITKPAPIIPVPPVKPAKDKLEADIEEVLEEDLEEMYLAMPKDKQVEFRKKGEETISAIRQLALDAHKHVKKIFQLIRAWLKMIPGVNRFFLEQEAKIKTDKVLLVSDEEKRRGSKL